MSYRDIRNFTEMMRTLGYPRLISMENFRVPNFSLVAEILQWLVLRYDPNSNIPMDVEHENDRVLFIKSVAQFMMTKVHIKLSTKRLYEADGMAIKELLKVTSVLYDAAMKVNKTDDEDATEDYTAKFDINSKIAELKKARQLASEITVKGSSLHQLLGREVQLREIRENSIARPMDLNDIEQHIDNLMKNTVAESEKYRHLLENIASDEANLGAKIEKRKAELERNQKRLKSLESVRPAFMDEYENLEAELGTLYQSYIEKYRNLSYLEQMNDEMNKFELEKLEESNDPMRVAVRTREENEKIIRGNLDFDDGGSDSDEADEEVLVEDLPTTKKVKPAVLGTMTGGLESDNDDSDFSGSDEMVEDDLLDDDDDDDEEDNDDDDDDENDGNVNGSSPANDSDDNF